MSNCSQNAMSAPKPIHGEIVWKDGMRPTPLSYARYVNGVERVADHIDFDGERYERVSYCEFEWRGCGDGTGAWYCTACNEYVDDEEPNALYCVNCGARVKEGGDD